MTINENAYKIYKQASYTYPKNIEVLHKQNIKNIRRDAAVMLVFKTLIHDIFFLENNTFINEVSIYIFNKKMEHSET